MPIEDFIPITEICKYCGDSNHYHENDIGRCIAEGCICKKFWYTNPFTDKQKDSVRGMLK